MSTIHAGKVKHFDGEIGVICGNDGYRVRVHADQILGCQTLEQGDYVEYRVYRDEYAYHAKEVKVLMKASVSPNSRPHRQCG